MQHIDPLLTFYRRCLGPGKKPSRANALHFVKNISLYTDYRVRHHGMSTTEAAKIIAEAERILEAS